MVVMDVTSTKPLRTNKEDYLIAWLTALAISVHIIEAAFPSPLPGVKPGLANVVTVAALILFGWGTAAWVGFLRVLVGSLLVGTFLSPTFALSLAGATASIAVLGIAKALPGVVFGPVGYCVLAAMAHMAAQFGAAYVLFIPHQGLFSLLPVLMTAALVFGLVSGFITKSAITYINDRKA